MPTKNEDQVVSKQGLPIEEGDHVYTKIRGGRHEGDVEKIITSEQEAKKENLKNPPKVWVMEWRRFRPVTDRFRCFSQIRRGKSVAHNPGTLDIVEGSEK
ncbi:hypothetical protein DM02DRAFT_545899 [Periconia macrospinosa]|uniref:Hypervirulence associated protein TUDOR domain-containing protein n=1 Tax=Periconia macrospinosa TaxID=97972 RepID=A0A2V1D028_9PLEO|nr:hypothetical protein DM02DRAFT_545899 [Periconia macrospinosa]